MPNGGVCTCVHMITCIWSDLIIREVCYGFLSCFFWCGFVPAFSLLFEVLPCWKHEATCVAVLGHLRVTNPNLLLPNGGRYVHTPITKCVPITAHYP